MPLMSTTMAPYSASFSFWPSLDRSMARHHSPLRARAYPRVADRSTGGQPHAAAGIAKAGAIASPRTAPAQPLEHRIEGWWRWGRIELPVQNTFPENFLQVFPANLRFALRTPDRRGASLAIR